MFRLVKVVQRDDSSISSTQAVTDEPCTNWYRFLDADQECWEVVITYAGHRDFLDSGPYLSLALTMLGITITRLKQQSHVLHTSPG